MRRDCIYETQMAKRYLRRNMVGLYNHRWKDCCKVIVHVSLEYEKVQVQKGTNCEFVIAYIASVIAWLQPLTQKIFKSLNVLKLCQAKLAKGLFLSLNV